MEKSNLKVRVAILSVGLPQYEIARLLGYNAEYFNRKLRYELPEIVQEDLITKINKLKAVN